jgi:diguanylate cyclase (GGDEF)-like protein
VSAIPALQPGEGGVMARIVRMAVVVVTIALFAGATLNAILGERELAVIFALAAPLGISAWGFVRAGHSEAAILLLCLVLTVVVTMVLLLSPLGVHDVALTAYGGIVLFAALLLSRGAFTAVAVVIVLAASGAFAGELLGATRSRIGGFWNFPQMIEFLAIFGVFAFLGRATVEIAAMSLGAAQRASADDPVTGLANRAGFFPKADHILKGLHAAGKPAVLVLVDLDDFRRVNLVVGHRAADGLLLETAQRLRLVAGDNLCARIGDDEFALLAAGVPEEGSEAFARKVHEAVTFDTLGVSLRSRLGYARFPRDSTSIESLLLAAESSLAHAKQPDARRFGSAAGRI